MKQIPLTQGHYAIVDDEDFEELNRHKWYAQKGKAGKMYAARNTKIEKRRTLILMHRQILRAKLGQQVDHINHDGRDNRKSNIRICTNTENNQNRKPQKGFSSVYKGVYCYKERGNWRSRIRVEGKIVDLGSFKHEIDAANAYDEAAREYFGEFACLNLLA